MAIVTYNDNGTIKVVKFGNYVVSTDADPIQKDWVFLHGADTWTGTDIQREVLGILDLDFEGQGCTNPYILVAELASLYDPNDYAIGTKAAIKMNANVGGVTCNTWAIFEVQAV